MTVDEYVDDIESALEKLGNVAATLQDEGEERALRVAAFALWFIQKENLQPQLAQFIEGENAPLDAHQRAHLRRLGLESPESSTG